MRFHCIYLYAFVHFGTDIPTFYSILKNKKLFCYFLGRFLNNYSQPRGGVTTMQVLPNTNCIPGYDHCVKRT